MCMAHERNCACGAKSVNFHFRDNIMPEQVVREVYCPACSVAVQFDPSSMIADNGWIIRYDMELARAAGGRLSGVAVTADALFDEGYCSWNGIYPGDHLDSVRERELIISFAKTNPAEYVRKMKTWAAERIERLKHEGWRKAQKAA